MAEQSEAARSRKSSVKPYIKAVFRHWAVAVVTFLAGVLGLAQGVAESTLSRDIQIPLWVWWGIFAVGFVYAQFLAFHDVRVERDVATLAGRQERSPREIFKDRLRFQIEIGEGLIEGDPSLVDYREPDRWPLQTADFLREALRGEGILAVPSLYPEPRAFEDELDEFLEAVFPTTGGDPDIAGGVRFLRELEPRADSIPLSFYFDAESWTRPVRS
jgi:hypothetical protein